MSLSHRKYTDNMPSIICSEIFAYKILSVGLKMFGFFFPLDQACKKIFQCETQINNSEKQLEYFIFKDDERLLIYKESD